jgi:hypothetical protein
MPTTVLWPPTTSFISVHFEIIPETVYRIRSSPGDTPRSEQYCIFRLNPINEHVASLAGRVSAKATVS